MGSQMTNPEKWAAMTTPEEKFFTIRKFLLKTINAVVHCAMDDDAKNAVAHVYEKIHDSAGDFSTQDLNGTITVTYFELTALLGYLDNQTNMYFGMPYRAIYSIYDIVKRHTEHPFNDENLDRHAAIFSGDLILLKDSLSQANWSAGWK